jgi:hypothetical protein
MRKRIDYLTNELERFLKVEPVKLRRELLNDLPNGWGIYLIRLPNSDNTLYIGTSSRLKQRIRNDLLGPSGAHTLKTKLYGYKKLRGAETINYLNKCYIQFMKGKEEYVVALEHFAISVLEPKLND